MTESKWQAGDRVVHTSRPEWGTGKVLNATSVRENGRDVQRVTVSFARAGTKTLSTAVASLAKAEAPVEVLTARGGEDADEPIAPAELAAKLTGLPDAVTDPFRTLANRLEIAVGLYRFEPRGKSLLDWAAAQTGLSDPLSAFSRHDLEEGYERFRRALDAHLAKLVQQARREEPSALSGLGNKVTPEVREMLTRLLTGR